MAYIVVKDALPTGATSSEADYINSSGEIAGTALAPNSIAVTWSTTGAATVLPGQSSGDSYDVTGLNDAGDVVANNVNSGQSLLWRATSPTILNAAGGETTTVRALNDVGDSIGVVYLIDYGDVGVYWNSAGASTILSGSTPIPEAINDTGEIGGVIGSYPFGVYSHAAEWSSKGSILWQSPDQHSGILAISSTGAAVGYDGYDAVYWSPSHVETVLSVGRVYSQNDAFAINDSGHSIGINNVTGVAYEWSETGNAIVLRALAAPTINFGIYPNAINDNDSVVGYEATNNGTVAVRWSKTGEVVNLQKILGREWSQTVATGINDAGDICGSGLYNGIESAWELLRVPSAAPDGSHYVNAASHHISGSLALAAHS